MPGDLETLDAFVRWLRENEMEICEMPFHDYYGRQPQVVTDTQQLLKRYLEESK